MRMREGAFSVLFKATRGGDAVRLFALDPVCDVQLTSTLIEKNSGVRLLLTFIPSTPARALKQAAKAVRKFIAAPIPKRMRVLAGGKSYGFYPTMLFCDGKGRLTYVELKSRKPKSRGWEEYSTYRTEEYCDVGESRHELVETTLVRGSMGMAACSSSSRTGRLS